MSDVLRTQIILHEIAHMLLGHTTPELTVAEETSPEELTRAGAYFEEMLSRVSGAEPPDIPIAEIIRAEAARAQVLAAAADPVDEFGVATDRILNLLGRTAFSSARERDAESLATLIHEQASRRSEVTATQADAVGTLGRLSDTFGHPARVRKK
ncbi:hypothetical protein [Streptomyces sp. x-80]|uniref:hypothetical protein n=1 Tax=Streptomyces sp. x-80 TaxID=2789282 RepID=UPI00397F5FB1